jgi:tetratricopeptide (TPR) repeat protein
VLRGIEDSPRLRRRVCAGVVVLAALLRILYVAEIHDHPYWRTPLVDAADYHARAMQVMHGEGLGADVYYKAPAYPWLLGQLYRVTGPRLEAAYCVQMLGGAAGAGIVTALGWSWFGPWAGVAGGLVTALYGPLLYFENQALIESAALFVSILAVFLLYGPWQRWMLPRLLGAGTAAGMALQLRPVNVALVAALLLHEAVARAPAAERMRRIACIVAPVLLLLVPTLRHNRVATGQLVPISVNGGINFYIGNNPDYDTTVAIRPGLRWEELTQRFDATDDPVRWQRNYYRAAFDWMRQHPGDAARLWIEKAVLFWNAREVDRNQDSRAMFGDSWVLRLGGLRWELFAPLGLLGLCVAWRSIRRLPLHALVIVQMLGVIAFFVTSRYRVAVVPWLGIAAGVGLQAGVEAWRRRDRRRLGRLALGLAAALGLVLPGWYGIGRTAFGRPDFDRAEVLARNGDRDGAMRAYEAAVARHPDDPDVRFRYGEHLMRFRRPAEAMTEYARAAELAPWSYKPLLALGTAHLEAGNLDAAWEAFTAAEARGDPQGRTLYDMGVVRERQGRGAEALELYRRSLERRDNMKEMLSRRLGMARALMLLGRREEAEVEFAAAQRLAPDVSTVQLERGAALLRAGDAAGALAILDQIAVASRSARAEALRARALLVLGRPAEARAAGERAAALDPASPAYRRWLERFDAGTRDASLDSNAVAGP